MNYLTLCQELVTELGLSGATGPAAVTSNSVTELKNVVRWIRDATLQIDNEFLDWKYLWQTYTATGLVAGATTLPAPPNNILVRLWNINRFRYRVATTGIWTPMKYYTRQRLLELYDPDNAVPASPSVFTINNANTIEFAAPLDAAYDFKAEYWQRPVPLAANTDTPLMPAEFHRAIVCRAAVMYGNREDAPEIITGMEAELLTIMDKLTADQLEGMSWRRTSTDRERQSDTRGFEADDGYNYRY